MSLEWVSNLVKFVITNYKMRVCTGSAWMFLQAWISSYINWLPGAELRSAACWAVPGLSHPKRCPPQRIWSGHQYRAVSCCILLTLLRSLHQYKFIFFLCFCARHSVLLLVVVFCLAVCAALSTSLLLMSSSSLRWYLITWPQRQSSSAPQTLSSTSSCLECPITGTVTTNLSGPEQSSDPGTVTFCSHANKSILKHCRNLKFKIKKFKLHPSSGLWRCVWTTAMRWSSLVLEKRHRANRRQLGSVPRSVCFTSSGGEIAARRCLSMMQRICFHIHW